MTERQRWRVALMLAGAVLGLAGFSSAAAGDEKASDGSAIEDEGWQPVLLGMSETRAKETGYDPILDLVVTSGGPPGLGYSVSEGVSFAVGYDYVTDENLDFEIAEAGAVDAAYASHEVMVRAFWHF